ncbi:hypothetical protein Bhyg_16313 [Pseudolycoriella hygida]|uniref:XK-related protein n=1 Tax=Pseudolycoriella hygida TaxID=35572 RepID=A0A9Q0MLI1_9DIPT|nr:hypothetical protein Bhyg_16313 [Pseudolycoriella hygida]
MSTADSSPPTSDFTMDNNNDLNIEIGNNAVMETNHNLRNGIVDLPPTNVEKHFKKCGKRCISVWKIIWAFLSFLISVTDVTVIIYLSYLHFHHSEDNMMAWLMLLPIVLNFIGIFTFLSNEAERKEMESLGCGRCKHLMFFPVIGPTFSQLRLFSYAFEEKNAEKYERLESLLIKMKQYEAFFRAAPEAFIQITFRIVHWSDRTHWDYEDNWTSLCIGLCMFALAESNIYASIRPDYYRLFNYCTDPDTWKTDSIKFSWKIALFWFNYLSIASRLFADAIFRASACFYFNNSNYGEVIIVTFIIQFVGRAITRAIYQNTLVHCSRRNHDRFHRNMEIHRAKVAAIERTESVESALKPDDDNEKGDADNGQPVRRMYVPVQEDLTGVYGAFTYSWRCLFMSFDYQDWVDPIVFFGFYVENVLIIGFSYMVIHLIEYDLTDKIVYYIYTVSAGIGIFLAIVIKYAMVRALNKRLTKKLSGATKY